MLCGYYRGSLALGSAVDLTSLTSPLKPDVFRVVMVVLLPGFLATFPWLAWFFWPDLAAVDYWERNGLVATLFVIAIAMVAGMVLEDVGADIEVRHIDPYVCKDKGIEPEEFERQWMSYLMTSAKDDFVAHRYLRSMVTRFKFELSMIPTCISIELALVRAWMEGVGFDAIRTVGFMIAVGGLGWFFVDQARKGGWQLHEMRMRICEAAPPASGCAGES